MDVSGLLRWVGVCCSPKSFNLGSSDDGNVYGLIACPTVIVICYLKLLTASAHVAIIASVEATR